MSTLPEFSQIPGRRLRTTLSPHSSSNWSIIMNKRRSMSTRTLQNGRGQREVTQMPRILNSTPCSSNPSGTVVGFTMSLLMMQNSVGSIHRVNATRNCTMLHCTTSSLQQSWMMIYSLPKISLIFKCSGTCTNSHQIMF